MKFMSLRIFAKNLNTFFLDSCLQSVYTVSGNKKKRFYFYSERIFIMNTTKNWVMRHLPYIGTAVLLCGIFCLIAKALSPEYLDAQGYLHENFFLLPISFTLLLAAVLLFLGAGIHFLKSRFSR